MRLSFKPFDGRSWNTIDVLDEDSNRIVGRIMSKSSGWSGIRVSLFDKNYEATVSTYEECLGFVKGVQAVLDRITSIDDGRTALESKLYRMEEAARPAWSGSKKATTSK